MASHLGLGHHPASLWAVSDRLAQPEGIWRPFKAPLFFRPAFPYFRHRTPVRGLYLASASCHPGAGVHGACGFNAARIALADARGNVVGVNTMVAGGLGLAVPSNAVARLLAGDLNQAPLGVVVHPAIVPVAGRKRLGLRILEVVRGSAAEYASLRQGDTLVGIEGQALRSLDDLEQAVEGGGDRLLRLEFVRDDPNKVRSVAVRLIVSQVADPERGRRAAMA